MTYFIIIALLCSFLIWSGFKFTIPKVWLALPINVYVFDLSEETVVTEEKKNINHAHWENMYIATLDVLRPGVEPTTFFLRKGDSFNHCITTKSKKKIKKTTTCQFSFTYVNL